MVEGLAGKTALVTGASRGIGAGIARGLAAAGATVVVNYATSRSSAEAVVSGIARDGGVAWAVQGDVSKPENVAKICTEIARRHDRLDVLVNNVGVYAAGPIAAMTIEHFRRLFDVNVLGLLLTTQATLPLFGPTGGSIINIGSLSGRMASPDVAVYAGTKGAVDAITLALSKELGPRKIRVNALNPGAVETDGLDGSGFLSEAMRAKIVASTPLGRLGRLRDIADATVFLASDASAWINGQIIFAAGGLTY